MDRDATPDMSNLHAQYKNSLNIIMTKRSTMQHYAPFPNFLFSLCFIYLCRQQGKKRYFLEKP